MSSTQTPGVDLLEAVLADYRAKGFTIYLHPSPSILPSFLKRYRPDAIATKENKNVAIEVTRSQRSEDKIQRLQELFDKQPDWEFVVVYSTPPPTESEIVVVAAPAIERAIQEVHELRSDGRTHAALIIGWAALEAVARALLPVRLSRAQTPRTLIEALASEGLLRPREGDSLREVVPMQNAAAHGQLNVPVEAKHLDALEAALRTLLATLHEKEN